MTAAGAASVDARRPADLVVYAADVRTMDPARPAATAVVIVGERIADVGARAAIDAAWRPARALDLGDATLTPGLVDAHAHLYGLGVDAEAVNLRGLASEAETVKAAAAAAATRPAGEWLLGRGWDQNRWPGQAFPTRATLDAAIADRPVILRRVDGHAIWVNTRALAAAGITRRTKDPAGGRIVRDARGEPTGVLIDNAVDLVDAKVPAATPAQRARRITAAAQQAIAAGLTGVHDMGIDAETVAAYQALAGAGELPLRVTAYLQGVPGDAAQLAAAPPAPTGRFALRGVKFFADGALGSRGARLHAPYSDDPKNRGLWLTEPAALAAATTRAFATGWQVAVHAIGDAAITATLDAFAAAAQAHPGDRRPRVEHLQVLATADLPRLKALGAIASMQPTHATSDMPWAEARVGAQRITGAYAWRTILDAGIPLAAGSDFPVEDVPPLGGLYAAVTRQDRAGHPPGGWYPAQRLTLDEAIAAFTRGAAYAEGAEARRGVIAPGMDADLTAFDRRLVDGASLGAAHVTHTVVGGALVFRAPDAPAPVEVPAR